MLSLSMLIAAAPGAVAMSMECEPTVQGIPYLSTLQYRDGQSKSPAMRSDFFMPEPGTAGGDIASFTLDSIKNWSGEGSKRAGLVIQWNTGKDNYALAFGYRFEGRPTGIDMLRCVVENNPQLYGLFQRTNVSSGNEKFGYTINGLGWDANCSGLPVKIIDTGNGDEVYSSFSGFFDHPRGCSESVSYPDYDYDNWIAADEGDYWQAGWYVGYWSYWLKEGDSGFSYSGTGASGRTLSDGSWDGWNYCPDMSSREWLPVLAVPSLVPEGFTEIFTIDGITYQLKDAYNAQVIKGEKPYSGEVTIPSTVATADGTFTINAIGNEAFAGTSVTKVTLPETIGTVGIKAFASSQLAEIILPAALTVLRDSVFYDCANLADINFPAGLTEIPAGAFGKTAIAQLSIPATIKTIQTGAFKDCSQLKEITLPAGLTQLSAETFAGCGAVTEVNVSATLPLAIEESVFSQSTYDNATLTVPDGFEAAYAAAAGWKNFAHVSPVILLVNVGDRFLIDGVPMRITSVNPNTVTVTYNHYEGAFRVTAVQNANAKLAGELIVPETITYMGQEFAVTEIQPYSFSGARYVTKVVLPENIEGLGANVFEGCSNLTSVVLPKNVTSIPEAVFDGCSKLSEIINLPERVDTIGASAFNQCSKLTSFPFFNEGLKVIGRSAFSNSGITSFTIPASVDSIGYQAFAYTKITAAEIPATVTKLGQSIFYQCSSLAQATLPAGLSVVPKYTFYNCKALTAIEIPEGVTRVDDDAFYGCAKLASVTLPSTLEEIGKESFRSNTLLTAIEFPASLRVIGDNAFYSNKLTSLYLPEAVDSIGKNAFYGGPFTEVTYPANVTRTGGYTFAGCTSLTKANLPENIVALPDGLFKGCTKLATIDIPASCTSIGYETFSGCTILNIKIPSQIESLGKNAFYGCKAIESVAMPTAITVVPENVFYNCTSLKSITLAPGTTAIEKQAFYGCSALKEAPLPESLETLGASAFRSCTSIESVTLPANITVVPTYAFAGCSALTEVKLAAGTTDIESYAFQNCKNLADIDFPSTLTSIGSYAFANCSAFTKFEFPASLRVIEGSAFQGCTGLPEVIEFPENITLLGGAVIQGTNVKKAFVHNPDVTEAKDYTFRTVSSYSNPVYCDVVVPYGAAEKCADYTGYKNVTVLTEPGLTDVNFSNHQVNASGESASLVAQIDPAFEEELSEKFLAACGNGFKENVTAQIVYSAAGADKAPARVESEPTENVADAAVNTDGNFEANLEGLKPNTTYSYKWRVMAGDKSYETEPQYFTTDDSTTAISEIFHADAPVEVYNLSGEYLGLYDSMSKVKEQGVVIVRQNNKTFKVLVK